VRRASIIASILCATLLGVPAVARAQTCNQESFQPRPIELGVSGSNFNDVGQGFCCAGTLGALVHDSVGRQYILSNNHVLARTNNASPGELIVQPGLPDPNGCARNSGNAVATLSASVPIRFGGRNVVDAAIAEIEPGAVDTSGAIMNIGPVAGGIDLSPLGAQVQKMGRSSCVTTGQVTAVSVTVAVKYERVCDEQGGVATFTNQIMITPSNFSAAGDSGSLVVTRESCPRVIGLLFAGSSTATFANPIGPVLTELRVRLVGGCTPVSVKRIPHIPTFSNALHGILPTSDRSSIAALSGLLGHYTDQLMNINGVVGTGIGLSERTGRPQLEIYVRKQNAKLRAELPTYIEDKPVRVRQIGEVVAY
jgi:hypothetical protein